MNERIGELVEKWNLSAGKLSPEELCADCPELLSDLKEAIAQLTAAGETPDDPDRTQAFDPAVIQSLIIKIPGYKILGRVGKGGQAVVYAAIQENTGRKVAVKVLLRGAFVDPLARARLDREVSILARLNHPNIVRVIDRGTTPDGAAFIVMSFVEGLPLDEFITSRTQNPGPEADTLGPLDPGQILILFAKICDAVQVAHEQGVIHRDLKPNNIIIDKRGEPRILDFGLARNTLADVDHQQITITDQFLGTVAWASPEQVDARELDQRTDIYSLGLILYYMLTGGKFPYNVLGPMAKVLNNIRLAQPTLPSQMLAPNRARIGKGKERYRRAEPALNPIIESIILKSLSKKPENRQSSAREMAETIRKYLSGLPVGPIPGASSHRSMGRPLLGAASLVLISAVVIVAWQLSHPAPHHAANAVAVSSTSKADPILPPVAKFSVVTPQTPVTAKVLTPTTRVVTAITPVVTVPTPVSVDTTGKQTIDLLTLVDPITDALQGQWKLKDGILIGSPENPKNFPLGVADSSFSIEMPYQPAAEYKLRIAFTVTGQSNGSPRLSLNLKPNGRVCPFVVDAGFREFGRGIGFLNQQQITGNGKGVSASPHPQLTAGNLYTLDIHVRNDAVSAEFDGKSIVDYQCPGLFGGQGGGKLALYGYKNEVLISKFLVEEMSGRGRLFSPAATPTDIHLLRYFGGVRAAINQVGVSADGSHAFARHGFGSEDGFRIWNIKTGELQHFYTPVTWPLFKNDRFVLAGYRTDPRIFALDTNAEDGDVPKSVTKELGGVLSPDGRFLVRSEGVVKPPAPSMMSLYDLKSGGRIWSVSGPRGDLSFGLKLCFSHDGNRILCLIDESTACVLETESGREIWRKKIAPTYSVAFSPHDKYVCAGRSAATPHQAQVLSSATGAAVATLNCTASGFSAYSFSPDDQSIVYNSGSLPSAIHLFEIATGKDNDGLLVPADRLYTALAFSPKGDRILVGGFDPMNVNGNGFIAVFDVASHKTLAAFSGLSAPANCLAISNDGTTAVSGSADGTVRVWRMP